jgi:hypothetical protein
MKPSTIWKKCDKKNNELKLLLLDLFKMFSEKFGEECPILDFFYQAGDGFTVLYANEIRDSNNSLINKFQYSHLDKMYNCKSNAELLLMLKENGG